MIDERTLSADVYAAIAKVYDRECDIEDAVDAVLEIIEADRKRRTPPSEPFAIVIDRIYDGEGPSLAYWNGENYQFSDGDCFNREGATLDGYTAEFLTDYQLEQRLFSDRERRDEPVGYISQEKFEFLSDAERDRTAGCLATIDKQASDACQVPIYLAPQPAEPDKAEILAAARNAGYSFARSADGVIRMIPAVIGESQGVQVAEPNPAQIRRAKLRTDPAKAAALDRARERIAAELANSADPVKVPSEAQEIRRLYRAIYKVMERLGEMLDKEQYGVIDRLLTDEGVEPPSTPEPPTSD